MTKFSPNQINIVGPISCKMNPGIRSLCISQVLVLILSIITIAPVADAGCACSSAGNWDPYAFLNSDTETTQTAQTGDAQASATGNSQSSPQNPIDRLASYANNAIFMPMKSVSSSDVVMDVSNVNSYSISHIKDAIHIPTKNFLNDKGDLKTPEELSKYLGDSGISIDDPIVLYGSKESSGEAEFAFLVLSYLGQKNVRLLDGNLADWKAAGLPEEASENKKASVEYKPAVNPKVMADYEYVKSGQAQIVDARPFLEFGQGRIPGSVALDPANIIKGDKIKPGDDLSYVFNRISPDKPVVVYSSDYSRSSLVWYALQLMGFDSKLYTWEDWKAHESNNTKSGSIQAKGASVNSKFKELGTT